MHQHTIEVDEEVFAHLQKQAAPFVDTPNSVLRRILLRRGDASLSVGPVATVVTHSIASSRDLPAAASIPLGAPDALTQILEVVSRVRAHGRDRVAATHDVAKRLNVEFQTVLDKYTRQIQLRAGEFDDCLAEPSLQRLQSILRTKFSRHSNDIARVLQQLAA